jgi:protein STE50
VTKARGWWVVERDRDGSTNSERIQGWVPAGCLLETNVSVADAVTDARTRTTKDTCQSPILPFNLMSTSYPGVALLAYQKKGDGELDLSKDDLLRVYKRYNNRSYVRISAFFSSC